MRTEYLGDGVMAYFGWPAAHDNDAERAARAGLDHSMLRYQRKRPDDIQLRGRLQAAAQPSTLRQAFIQPIR